MNIPVCYGTVMWHGLTSDSLVSGCITLL